MGASPSSKITQHKLEERQGMRQETSAKNNTVKQGTMDGLMKEVDAKDGESIYVLMTHMQKLIGNMPFQDIVRGWDNI